MNILQNYPSIVFGAIFTFYVLSRYGRRRNGPQLPPGPKGLPLIGNVFDMPIEKQWLTYHEWQKKYGEQSFSSFWDFVLIITQETSCPSKFYPVQVREARRFIVTLRDSTPESLFSNIRSAFVAIIMASGYGLEVKDKNNRFVSMAEEALEGLSEAGIPGRFVVDLVPLLKHIPFWIPGAGFLKFAAHMKQVNHSVEVEAWNEVKEQLKRGTAVPSLATTLIEKLPNESDPEREKVEKIARGVASVVYVGGTDTTVSSMKYFFLAMTHYPEVLRKAQAEIDAVIGSNRLPDFSDRDSLPYINALAKETTRWIAVTPLGVGHMSTQDDVYDGYLIPKGSIILGNVWSILRDPEAYPEPEKFKPERFLTEDGKLDKNVRDPALAAFGFGRRICPGRHFSDNSLFIFIASTVAVYDILPPIDESGNPIEQHPEITGGLITSPLPFKCIIKPRSTSAEALIRDAQELEV
ncbi:cytochrome P450 [Cyathus striatus]|nr:cytochrome P450 [Cyathus striatus]